MAEQHRTWKRHHPLPGFWQLSRISLSKADIRSVLCTTGAGGNASQRDSNESDKGRGMTAGNPPGATDTPQSPRAGARRRGPRALRLEQTKTAMRNDLQQGRVTARQLDDMLEKTLTETYGGVSRETVRKARNVILSEFEQELNSRQTPTNDK